MSLPAQNTSPGSMPYIALLQTRQHLNQAFKNKRHGMKDTHIEYFNATYRKTCIGAIVGLIKEGRGEITIWPPLSLTTPFGFPVVPDVYSI